MTSGFIVRLRPTGPWRLGPSSGARDRVDRVLHSDTLFSALTISADHLGFLSEWLTATVDGTAPQVRVGSGFPFVGRTLLAPAPKHVWPPAAVGKARWKAARFVPLQIVPRLLAYENLKEDRWAVDPISECILPVEKFGEVTPPFRVTVRRTAAVDRPSNVSTDVASTACLEFAEGAGIWCAVLCSDDWKDRVQSLFRFLADSGIGGERSLGWGRSAAPEFDALPAALTAPAVESEQQETGYWMLSLFAPGKADRVDWSRGAYGLLRRSGRTEYRGELKTESAMVEEGSVVIAESDPIGLARNVAPEHNGHAVYRAGFAVAVPVAVRLPGFQSIQRIVETPTADEGSFEDMPPSLTPAVEPSPALPDLGDFKEIAGEPEPFEDASAKPEPMPAIEAFSVETEPIPEQTAASDTAVEDAPAKPEPIPAADSSLLEVETVAEQAGPSDAGEDVTAKPSLPDEDGSSPEEKPEDQK